MTDNWLREEIRKAKEQLDSIPDWMKEQARFAGGVVDEASPLDEGKEVLSEDVKGK